MYRFIVIILYSFLSLAHLKAEEIQVGNLVKSGIQPPLFLKVTPDRYLTLSSQSLGKEFFLQPIIVSQHPLQTFQSLASRVVIFHKVGSRLFLLQSLKGNVQAEDIHSSIILAEFSIIKHLSSDNELTFDFNEGMSHIFTTQSIAVSDFGITFNNYSALEINNDVSYLDEVTSLEDNRIFIRQKAQLRRNQSKSSFDLITTEVRYLLEPYQPHLDFEPLLSTENFDYMGFFESLPQLSSRRKSYDLYALKYDIKKPIVFSLSSSIPEKHREAIREGVLYWNKAFGKEVVSVDEAPSTVTSPHPDYNIIHWSKSDALMFAYVDMQNDPKTGKILNSQIFVGGGLDDIFQYIAQTFITSEHDKKSQSPLSSPLHAMILNGFEKEPLCSYQYNHRNLADFIKLHQAFNSIEFDSQENSYNKKILQMTSDIITSYIAHEVGHVLGLRHNFAGNLVKDIHHVEYTKHWNNYIESGEVPSDMVISSSIMDYLTLRDLMMLGSQIRSPETAALSHDKLAIEFLYGGKTLEEFKLHDLPLYCPDTLLSSRNSAKSYLDCTKLDTFGSQAMEAKHRFQVSLESLPHFILQTFVFWLNPPWGYVKKDLSRIKLYPEGMATRSFIAPQKDFLKLLTPKSRLLKVDRSFTKIDGTNQEYVEEKTVESIAQDIINNGGLDEVLKLLPRDFVATETQRLFDVLTKGRKGIDFNGSPYEFNEKDIQFIQNQGERFYTVLWKKFHTLYLESFTSLKKIRSEELSNDLAKFLYRKSKHYLMTTTNSFIQGSFQKEGRTISVKVPNFVYNFETRELAAKILTQEWAEIEMEAMEEEFHLFLQKFLEGEKITDIEKKNISKNLRVWHREQIKILKQLK